MAFQATPYTLPLAASAVAFVAFAVHLARQEARSRDVRYAIPLLLATSVWMLGYAAELSVTSTSTQLLFARVQYIGNVAAPPLWFAYVLSYVGYGDLLTRRRAVALAVPPVMTYALVLAFPATTLVWAGAETVSTGGFLALETDHGPAFYAFMAYVYSLVTVTVWLLARRFSDSAAVYRRQTAALLVGALVPAAAGVVYIADASPVPALNLPAIAFVATAGAVAWSVARNELFRLAPVAWETVVREFDSAVFVLDDDGRVVAANPEGRRFTAAPVGAHAGDALTPALGEDCWREPGQYECEAFQDGDPRVFEVTVTPVEREGSRLGRAVTVRDVTERHAREERLAEFANVVSHDLRNPLNVAKGHLELGRETHDDEHFEETADALDRIDRIIEDLLTLAREENAERDRKAVSLATIARTAWGSVATTDVDATFDVRGDRTLAADETALLRLFENLFRNSVEHGSTNPVSQARQDAVEHGSTSPRSASPREDAVEHGATGSASQTRQNATGTSSGEPSVADAPEDAVEHGSTSPRSQAREDAVEHGTANAQVAGETADDAGSALAVSVGATDDGFFVADDGPGVPRDEREQIFERGYTTNDDGTGFGLPIVEQVANAHGWSVELADSDDGARFEFTVE